MSVAAFVGRRTREANTAALQPFATVEDRSSAFSLDRIDSGFTRPLFDGPFYLSPLSGDALPQISLVFVQSRDGNTGADDPSSLGGGDTDKHLVYEGLSRVAADAVLAGARTVGDGRVLFSVWHPELVELRASLGKPRHPVQIVATLAGALPIEDGLIFNVPDVPVVILSAGQPAANLTGRVQSRPWITVLSSGYDLRAQAEHLRRDLGIERISSIGGRTLATALIDAGLVSDLYLTTSVTPGGTPHTPFYAGSRPPARELVVRKRDQAGRVFEHWLLET